MNIRNLLSTCLASGLLMAGPIAQAQPQNDRDGDGAADAIDAFPCDSARDAAVYWPAEGQKALIVFEDSAPEAVDLDVNDVGVQMNLSYSSLRGQVVSLEATVDIISLGGDFDMGLGFQLPFSSQDTVIEVLDPGSQSYRTIPNEGGDPLATVVLYENLRSLFGDEEGPINADPAKAFKKSPRIKVRVQTGKPMGTWGGNVPLDVFVFRSGSDPRHETHFPDFPGTAKMDFSKIGVAEDISTPGYQWIHKSRVPYALNLMTSTLYPQEAVGISSVFPDIVGFATSNGSLNKTFYASSNVVEAKGNRVDSTSPDKLEPRAAPDNTCSCPMIANGQCSVCSGPAPSNCDVLTCNVNRFDVDNNPMNGCEAGCAPVQNGTCHACSGAGVGECTDLRCDSGFVNDQGFCVSPICDESNPPACGAGCPTASGSTPHVLTFSRKGAGKGDKIECDADRDCQVYCTDEDACQDAKIYCPEGNHTCTIVCDGEAACKSAKLYNSDVGPIVLTCTGEDACQDAKLYCNEGSCAQYCPRADENKLKTFDTKDACYSYRDRNCTRD